MSMEITIRKMAIKFLMYALENVVAGWGTRTCFDPIYPPNRQALGKNQLSGLAKRPRVAC
jgi:hypothetical protein